MESKHKELLEKCYQNLMESITDADAVVGVLAHSGTLSQSERYELEHNCTSNSEKVDLLLKMLISKERDHFRDLCTALEKTHPHLSSVLFNGTGPVDHISGSTYSVLSTMPSDSESSSSLSSLGEWGVEVKQVILMAPLFSFPLLPAERAFIAATLPSLSPCGLLKSSIVFCLFLKTHCPVFDPLFPPVVLGSRPHSRSGQDYERLKMQCMKAMADLQSLQNQHSSTLKRCEEAVKKADFYHTLHGRLASEQAQLKEETEALRLDNMQLLREHGHSTQACDELRRLRQGDLRDAADMRTLHQQVMREGSSDVLSKLYDATAEKLAAARRDYEALRKRYGEQTASHNADLGRLAQADGENQRLQAQLDALLQQRDAAVHRQQQYSSTGRRYDTVQQELAAAAAQNKELQRETERLQAEATRLKTQQLKAAKDCDKYKEERDSVFSEYRLIMSERDQVIKEVDKLQTGLELAEARLKNTSSERRVAGDELEALRQKQDSVSLDMERATKEMEVLRKQHEAVSQELKEASQEAEVAKCRRDWAFQERDKMVAERESIRTLCDNLRRERDRAVSDLADALRNLDDTRKQKNDAARELKELKEKVEDQLEKEARFRQLMAHSSHDSAIDTDSMEWETEVVEFEKDRDDMDLKALGFDIAEGVSDPYLPGDCGIFVSRVDKGSVAEGRLRVNDWLLKINDVDLANKDRKQVIKAVLGVEGVINMVVRRRRSLGTRVVTPVQLSLVGHKDSGIGLESGVFVAGITPGSPAAKDSSLTPGDRLLAINGIAVDNKSLSDCEALLRSCRDTLSISLMKFHPHSCSGQSLLSDCDRSPGGRPQSCEIHARSCRHPKHNNSTQTDIYSPDGPVAGPDGPRRDPPADGFLSSPPPYHLKPSPSSSLHSHPLAPRGDPPAAPEPHPDYCCRRPELLLHHHHHQHPRRDPAFSPPPPGDGPPDPACPGGGGGGGQSPPPTEKPSGGTWPKVVGGGGTGVSEFAQLSIFKRPKPRKSIFDVDAFKRPDTVAAAAAAPKLDYLSLSQQPRRSPQSPVSEGPAPPTPPARSDSFRFKRRHQNSSASDSTIAAATPPASPVPPPPPPPPPPEEQHGPPATVQRLYGVDTPTLPPDAKPGFRRAGEGRRPKTEEHERKRYRPGSAPALRRNVTPLHIPIPTQVIHRGDALPPPRGSLSHSECSSPTPPLSPVRLDTASFASSQSQGSIAAQARISVSPAPIGDRRKDRPYLEDPRNVMVQKGAEPLGISIVSGESGGVFVSKVTAGSIAHQARLEYGDQLLEFNGINLRNANEQQARLVIGQQCDTVTVLAQYNPHMVQLGNGSHSGSCLGSISNQATPDDSSAGSPDDDQSAVDTLSEPEDEGTITPPSRLPGSASRHAPTPSRLVRLKRTPHVELGVQICGGNLCGIYVESLDEDSPARVPEGLLPGDLIVEVTSQSRNKTVEEAYLELLKPGETVTFKVQHLAEDLTLIKEFPGDGFFIRALYDRVADGEQELSFKKDDILYVEDTLPNGNFGYWMAWQLDEHARKLEKGQVPSKYMVDQEFYRRHGGPDTKDENGAGKSLSAAARRSFFRRRLKHKRSGSKDGKDLAALEAFSTDSLPVTEDGVCLAYQRVQKVECSSPRPVLVLGPLVEANKDMLVKEAPAKFFRCLPEVMKASQQAIERGVKDCVFIDYKRRSGHFDVTTVASIKEITERDCHCLLDIAPHAIERLHSVHIYPIVIFIRYKNAKQIKEQKDPQYLREKVSQKHSKEQFESAQKIEQDYSRFFTGVVQGGSLSYICTQILTVVEQEQSKVLWIPDGAP
uniref:Discs large MAGUK scaffold protein 5 n=1 Tax=Gadus morhua TaxID=8049 RepID=A0A8C4ZXY9_GADMO